MIKISEEEKEILRNYFDIDEYIANDDLSALEIKLDDLITSRGFDENYDLTKEGRMLQDIYDSIYLNN